MKRRTALAWLGASPFTASIAQPVSYPDHTVKMIVGFAPGGAVDELARLIAEQLGPRLKQPVIVENKPGAASTFAGELVANAPAAGHTLFFSGTSVLIARHLQQRAEVDLSRFAPVASVASTPLVLVASTKVPVQDPQSFVQEIKRQPGKYFYATSGVGTLQHLGMEMIKRQLGLKLDHVPYRGAPLILPDLFSGQVSFAIVSANVAATHEKAGKLRAIGLMSAESWPSQPQWKSMASVAPGFNVMPRIFLLAPAATSNNIIRQLGTELAQVMRSPELIKNFAGRGALAQYASSEALRAELERDDVFWSDMIKSLGLRSN